MARGEHMGFGVTATIRRVPLAEISVPSLPTEGGDGITSLAQALNAAMSDSPTARLLYAEIYGEVWVPLEYCLVQEYSTGDRYQDITPHRRSSCDSHTAA